MIERAVMTRACICMILLAIGMVSSPGAHAGLKMSIEDYCAIHQDTDSETWRTCVAKTYLQRFVNAGSGLCSQYTCVYKLKSFRVAETGDGIYRGNGYSLKVVPWTDADTGMLLGHRGRLVDPAGAVTRLTQSCGAACNFPAEWTSGAHQGASYRDVKGVVFLTIPKAALR